MILDQIQIIRQTVFPAFYHLVDRSNTVPGILHIVGNDPDTVLFDFVLVEISSRLYDIELR